MPYLIDGHNLIPKIAGLALDQLDDEQQLIEMLQEFCRIRRKQVEIYFDNAPAGQPRARNYGMVIARFARSGQTADALIAAHLTRLGRSARNWTVVSSDRAVQVSAKAARASSMPSEEFALLLREALQAGARPAQDSDPPRMDDDELDEWLDLFGGKK